MGRHVEADTARARTHHWPSRDAGSCRARASRRRARRGREESRRATTWASWFLRRAWRRCLKMRQSRSAEVGARREARRWARRAGSRETPTAARPRKLRDGRRRRRAGLEAAPSGPACRRPTARRRSDEGGPSEARWRGKHDEASSRSVAQAGPSASTCVMEDESATGLRAGSTRERGGDAQGRRTDFIPSRSRSTGRGTRY